MTLRINNNKRYIPFILMFFVEWILFTFNTGSPDYLGYKRSYDNFYYGGERGAEIGFRITCRIFRSMHFTYNQFLAVFSFFFLLLLAKSILDYSDSPGIAMFSYLLYPFLYDVIQVRQFACGVLIIYAIRYLKELSRKNLIRFLLYWLLAISFHSSGLIYLVFLVVYIKDLKRVAEIMLTASAVIFVIILNANNIILTLFNRFSFLGENYRASLVYFSFNSKYTNRTYIFFAIGIISLLLTFFRYRKNHFIGEKKDYEFWVKIVCVTLFFIPLIKIGNSFDRLYRGMLPVLYCVLTQETVMRRKSTGAISIKLYRLLPKLYAVLLAIIFCLTYVLSKEAGTYEHIYKATLSNNSFLNFWHIRLW